MVLDQSYYYQHGGADFFVWGLATANAITLKILESATWRKIGVEDFSKNIDTLKVVMEQIPFSKQQLKDAYERMDMGGHPWTKGTKDEIDFVENIIGGNYNIEILDLGCGEGRHCIELYKRCYENISGIDFSEKNIKTALSSATEQRVSPMFNCADARILSLGKKFDLVLCLFDVIGSFMSDKDNMRILRTVKRHLRKTEPLSFLL